MLFLSARWQDVWFVPRNRSNRKNTLRRQLAKAIGGLDQRADDAGLGNRMPCIGNYLEISFRPGAVQVPGAHDRTNDVVPALNNHGRDVPDLANVIDEVIVAIEENVVDEVVTLDSR